jgi:hypothetical protein
MSVPLFIKVQDTLINIAHVEAVSVEDESLCMATGADAHEFEFEGAQQAAQALQRVQAHLAAKNLLIGEVQ